MTFMCSNLASLPLVLLGLHSAPKDDQACSSAEAVYGPPLMLPGLFLGLQPSEKFLDRSILQSFSTSPSRVSTKWLNLLRYFRANLYFANFCAIFAHETQWVLRNFSQNRIYFFAKCCSWNEILVLRNFFAQFAQNHKFYAKCNFLGKL